MSNLKTTIEKLASDFALNITNALRSASLDELMALSSREARIVRAERSAPAQGGSSQGGRRRRGRRTGADLVRMTDRIVRLLEQNPGGLRAEAIRESLQCQSKELPRPLAQALSSGLISKTGQKRATTYFAGSKGAASEPKKRGRKARG